MSTDRGVHGIGAYAPRYRIGADAFREAWGQFDAAGIEEKAVPAADEDALTMAHEAGTRALAVADREGDELAWIGLATTTPPLAEGDLTARLGSMLAVPADATRHVFTGSTRAGTRALEAALAATGPALVVASDCPMSEPDDPHEHAAGAGAVALLVDADAPLEISDRAEYATPYPGTRFRPAAEATVRGLSITSYDRQAYRETLVGAVEGVTLDPAALDAAAIQAPDGGLPYRVAGALGLSDEQVRAGTTVHELGDTGAASPLLGLATAIEDGASTVLLVGYGAGGGADAVLLRGSAPAGVDLGGDEELTYPAYLRRRGDIVGTTPDGGAAHVSVPTWRRSLPQRHRLVAGACPACGGLTFPPEGACGDCDTLVSFDPVPLRGPGRVEAATRISRGGEPPEFAAQQARSGEYGVALVAFEAGDATVSLPAQVVGGTVAIGDPVTPTIRRIYTEEDVTRYGIKVAPA